MLEKVKLLLGLTDTSKDEVITLLIQSAITEAITITHNEDICDLEDCICSMVLWEYNRLNSMGLNSENYSGVSFNYSPDYPEVILRQLKAHRKVRVIR